MSSMQYVIYNDEKIPLIEVLKRVGMPRSTYLRWSKKFSDKSLEELLDLYDEYKKQREMVQELKELGIPKSTYNRWKRENPGITNSEIISRFRQKTNEHTNLRSLLGDYANESLQQIADRFNVSKTALSKHLNAGERLEDFIPKILETKQFQTPKTPKSKKGYNSQELLDEEVYKSILPSSKPLNSHERQPIEPSRKNRHFYINNEFMHSVCLKRGYNIAPIYYQLNAGDCSVEEAVSYYEQNGQQKPSIHKNIVGSVLFYHFLLNHNLDRHIVYSYIKKDGLSKEEAITKAVFFEKKEGQSLKECQVLYEMYRLFSICTLEEQRVFYETYKVPDHLIDAYNKKKARSDKINRNLLLLELSRMFQICDKNEKEQAIEVFGITKEELGKITSGELYRDYTLVTYRNSGERVYIKQPKQLVDSQKQSRYN